MGSSFDEPTWGIPGPTFLLAYALIALVMLALASGTRRSIAAGRPVDPDHLQARPEDVAHLNGGPELAVWSALSAMHVDGTIATSGPGSAGVVRSVGTPVPGSSDLQRAIHVAALRPIPRRSLMRTDGVERALDEMRGRLEAAGLLLTAEQRSAYRRPGAWMLGVLALGVARMFAGLASGQPVDYLFGMVLVVAGATVILFKRIRTRTAAGDAALAAQRSRHGALSPSMRPDWGAVGAGAAALSVGVFGVGALTAAEPAFAEELEAQKSAAMGGGSGWSGGSDGGGGSGDGGGGGGCGGGCGGGGCGG